MSGIPLYILLCSGEHEKLQMAAMMAAVAAVSERPVEVFVSMEAILAFDRAAPPGQRCRGGAVSRLLVERQAPGFLDLFRQGRSLGQLKLWACAMALDLQGWELDRLEDGLFDGPAGLTRFLADAEAGQLVAI